MQLLRLLCANFLFSSFIIIFLFTGCKSDTTEKEIRTGSFDNDWLFMRGDPSGAQDTSFDDSEWRRLDLPHDWSIEDIPEQYGVSVVGPYSKTATGKRETGYTVGGRAWYRKHFVINEVDKNKIAYLQFDGIYMNADVWINGHHIGNHPYGYTSFYHDITSYLNPPGDTNVVAVQVKNEGRNTRWYSGSGIYRHTWLTLVNPIHVVPWEIYITTPDISKKRATVNVETKISNNNSYLDSVVCEVKIFDPTGTLIGNSRTMRNIQGHQSLVLNQVILIDNPKLWSIENPQLYYAQVELFANGNSTDRTGGSFGIRSMNFDPKTGFTLNGKNVLLKGGNFHHDNGPLGSAAIDRAIERKIELLKKAGFNTIRTSHNPPSPYLLDVCDRTGMLVVEEAFDLSVRPIEENSTGGEQQSYYENYYTKYFKDWWQKDIKSMVLRDRNHPSIIMWSIGNENLRGLKSTKEINDKMLVDEIKKTDKSRPVTKALIYRNLENQIEISGRSDDTELQIFDVLGYKYEFSPFEEKNAEKSMFAAEYRTPQALQSWNYVENSPTIFGSFSWTALDYLGEAGLGVPRLIDITQQKINENPDEPSSQFFNPDPWPYFINFQGNIDFIGNPKPAYYYQQVVWRDEKISMLVHRPIPDGKQEIVSPWGFPDLLKSWLWPGMEGEIMEVYVFTRCEKVKLELNGKLVGEKQMKDNTSITTIFKVLYEPGVLRAFGYDQDVEVVSETITTTGEPAFIKLTADRSTISAQRNDLSYVLVEITDKEGKTITSADDILVNFEISGNGEIAGVGSGSPSDISSFQQPRKKTWHGRCLAIIRPSGSAGRILLTAKAEGLVDASVEIITNE